MTAYRYTEIACDGGWPGPGPARLIEPTEAGEDQRCYKAYSDLGTAEDVRARARQAGWGRHRNRDLCPDCRKR